MYIECKAGNLTGPARIGRVTYSKTGATIYYHGKEFRSLKGAGFKANYYDVETGDEYWISGPRKDGKDALYATNIVTEIDADVSDEYWTQIRTPPGNRPKTPPQKFRPKTFSMGSEQFFRWDKALATADTIGDEELARKLRLR